MSITFGGNGNGHKQKPDNFFRLQEEGGLLTKLKRLRRIARARSHKNPDMKITARRLLALMKRLAVCELGDDEERKKIQQEADEIERELK